MELRPYQTESVSAIWRAWVRAITALVVLPTGTGKSLVIAALVRELLTRYPGIKILVLAHVKELVRQNAEEFAALCPDIPCGIYSAGLNRRDMFAPVTFSGIQSFASKIDAFTPFNAILIDEAHLIPPSADSRYGAVLQRARELNGRVKIAGLTATPFRLDQGHLCEGDNAIFSEVSYEYGIAQAIADEYLAKPVSKRGIREFDTSSVRVQGGEFKLSDLERVAADHDLVEAAVSEIIELGAARGRWLIFAVSIDHAEIVAQAFREKGIPTAAIHSRLSDDERDATLRAYKAGELRAMTNVQVMTTGSNIPQIDLLAMLRPTLSTSLYVQMIGRGLRLFPGKADCLVLDYAGNVRRHGPLDQVEPKGGKVGRGEIASKTCKECEAECALNARTCPNCGFTFGGGRRDNPLPHNAQADGTLDVLASDNPVRYLHVRQARAMPHAARGRETPSLRVIYSTDIAEMSRFYRFGVGGAGFYARQWWQHRGGELPEPGCTDEAMARINQGEISWPECVRARRNGRFFEVIGDTGTLD